MIGEVLSCMEKWKFLAHQSDALIILAIVQFSMGMFTLPLQTLSHIWVSRSDKPHMISSWFSLAESYSVFLCLQCDLDESISSVWSKWSLVESDFHLHYLSSHSAHELQPAEPPQIKYHILNCTASEHDTLSSLTCPLYVFELMWGPT